MNHATAFLLRLVAAAIESEEGNSTHNHAAALSYWTLLCAAYWAEVAS